MNTARTSFTSFGASIGLALLLSACGQSTANPPQEGSGGSTVTDTGGSGGNAAGSAGGTANGGAGGAASGGSGGGAGGAANGGSTVNPGNSGGNAMGGAAGTSNGGTSVTTSGGVAGGATGGTTVTTSGKGGATAGTPGTGGSPTGGVQGTGGATNPGSGGATVVANTLVTSASGAYWKTGTWTEVTSNATVTVDDSKTSQTWEGFGGAFNEKGWSYLTTKALQDEAIQLLFGKEGCNFAWGRIPIGASDYAMDRYSLNENAGDNEMTKFSIDRDKQKLIPYIKAALAVKPDIRFWASPWSPPTWMKTAPFNPNTGKSNSNFDGGVMKSDETTLKAFALYFVKFIQAYAEQGINVEIVSPQNEPNYEQNYPTCKWATSTFVNFIGKHLGPALASANLSTKVMDGTLSNPSGDADIGQSVLKDATAKGFIKSIGVQWGMAEANQVTPLKNLAGGISIWISETKCDGNIGSSGPAPNDFNYAKATWGYITGAIKNGLTAYNSWNMVLDKNGLGIDDTRKWAQNTLLVADSGAITKTPAYYVYRHFSQFVDPGAKVVGTSGGDAIAFKNPDGSIVAIMYSASANNSYVVSIGGKKLQFAIPAGWATVKYKP